MSLYSNTYRFLSTAYRLPVYLCGCVLNIWRRDFCEKRAVKRSAKQCFAGLIETRSSEVGSPQHNLSLVSSDRIFYRRLNAIKVCIIDQQPSIIYHAEFPNCHRELFLNLQRQADLAGWQLIEDRRKVQTDVKYERRQKAILVSLKLATATFLFDSNTALALDDGQRYALLVAPSSYLSFAASDANAATVVRPLGLFSPSSHYFAAVDKPKTLANSHSEHDFLLDQIHSKPVILPASFSQEKYNHVLSILKKKWAPNKRDPDYLAKDFEQMAEYIASRSDAYELLISVRKQPWTLHHQSGEFRSDVRGNTFSVSAVKIYFDTRSAAQLKSHKACIEDAGHCMASPVDALLHELLHAKIALMETASFLKSGGMNGVVYPYQHERKVIALENQIYRSMSNDDNRSRPRRNSHTGNLLAASCVTCIGS